MMMESEEINKNDYLGRLIARVPLDEPGEDFISRLMEKIEPAPVTETVKHGFLHYLKSFMPYAALFIFALLIAGTSDIPFLSGITGEGTLLKEGRDYIVQFFAGMKDIISSGYFSWGIMITAAAGLLYLTDYFFSRRSSLS